MELREYYRRIFPRLERSFEHCHYVLGYGQELIARGWNPNSLLVIVQPVDKLRELSVDWGLEVFLPVLGTNSDSVLLPFDFEIHLADFRGLYASPAAQQEMFQHNIGPVAEFLTHQLTAANVYHMMDYTPSGAHILVRVMRGSSAWDKLAAIGFLDDSVFASYTYHDPHDIKRNPPVRTDAALVFSAFGFLSELLALRALQELQGQTKLPLTLWDSQPDCMNLDLSWTADPGYMRIIRAPFSAHKKRSQQHRLGPNPLVDVIGRLYAPEHDYEERDYQRIIACMWQLDQAAAHAEQFSGAVPVSDDGLARLCDQYSHSELARFHDYCHIGEGDLQPGEALHRVLHDGRLSQFTKDVALNPNPRMLQPRVMRKVVSDLCCHGWHPRHIKNLLTDRYQDPAFGWHINFAKYNAHLKAWAFARQYCAEHHLMHDGWRV